MKRRIFACLLALVMLVSVLPVALAADPVAKTVFYCKFNLYYFI